MPCSRAASITKVPGRTVSWRSSSLNFISAVSAMFLRLPERRSQQFRRLIRTLTCEMLLEFVGPFFDDAYGGQGRRVAQRAESSAQHVFRQLPDQGDIFAAAAAGMEPVEHFAQPIRALAARYAPAARLMSVEMHDAPRQVDHAGGFIDDNEPARSQH